MELNIKYIPYEANEWTVTRAIAKVIHSEDFEPRASSDTLKLLNFRVELNHNEFGGIRNNGTGSLILPTEIIGNKFLSYTFNDRVRIGKNNLKFFKKSRPPRLHITETLRKTYYINPDIEEERQGIIRALDIKLPVDAVQFGCLYRSRYPSSDDAKPFSRSFSIEWEHIRSSDSSEWLRLDYDAKLIRIDLGDELTQQDRYIIAIKFSSVQKIAVGYDGKPYICFDTFTPPILEKDLFHRTTTGDNNIDFNRIRERICAINEGHAKVAPYAFQLRIALYSHLNDDPINDFINLWKSAGLSQDLIIKCSSINQIESLRQGFFPPKRMYKLHKTLAKFPWPVSFQLESLLRNGLLHTDDLDDLLVQIVKQTKAPAFMGDLLRRYNEALQLRPPTESPMRCFQRTLKKFEYYEPIESFRCYHVTFTPTRMLLEGPYASQSNRVIRQYRGYEDHFIRVDFREEDRLQYRWDREVDATSFLEERVGGILKKGFELAGRDFEFLAYSFSALRDHAVWFVNPFYHAGKGCEVNGAYIRDSLGNFRGTTLLRCPSKYAARLAQAFTATNPSVDILRSEWDDVMPDLGKKDYLFTDGVGTVSKALGWKIWRKLCETTGRDPNIAVQPSAYQIRFLGFKGVVAVDEQLDLRKDGIQMRLRASMKKFEVNRDDAKIAPLEIAQAFEIPTNCFLNRPLVMLLEDVGVTKDTFQRLQDVAVADAKTIDDSITHCCDALSAHNFGSSYKLRDILGRLRDRYNMDLKSNGQTIGIDGPFLQQIRQVAMIDILRDIKHSARIPIPDSYLLVGIADEGPAYAGLPGYEDVYCLSVGEIYACIQKPNDPEPTWVEGNVSISRSPVVHPGDVQRVRAIGKPPDGQICLFRHLKNVVVMPSVGPRSLASCLGGGDVDGDQFSVICVDALLPKTSEAPASYEPLEPNDIGRDSTVEDICDFVVEYINLDILGILSVRLLTLADQSIEGMHDPLCKELAEFCSQAVDYPKQGTPPNIDINDLPKTLIRLKPDWHASEVVSPRKTDYYESSRALGYLFRAITIKEKTEIKFETMPPGQLLSDPISIALLEDIRLYLGSSALIDLKPSSELTKLFQRYVDELRYICAVHTLSNTPENRLLEAEVVVGTIIDNCTPKGWRKDRKYRMRLHAETLVKDVRRGFFAGDAKTASMPELIWSLERAWSAWDLSLRNRNEFGANSFSLVALGAIFDCLDNLASYQ